MIHNSTCDHIIRPAAPGDFEAILSLNAEWVHFTSPLNRAALTRLHAQSAYHRVIESGDRICAFLLALREGADYESPNYRWFNKRGGTFLYVDRVIVDRSEHGNGIGAMLYNDVIEFGRSQHVDSVACELDIDPPNEASRVFHDHYGFREVGTQVVAEGSKRVSLRTLELH